MRKLILISSLIFLVSGVFAQHEFISQANGMKASKEFENILVEKLFSDSECSSFVIWVKDKVRLHKHEFHSEHVYVLKGKGEMIVGERTLIIKKGDVIFIPKNTPHAVEVKGGTLKVLSVQAPEFKGKDRIFLDE